MSGPGHSPSRPAPPAHPGARDEPRAQRLAARFGAVRAATVALAAPLSPEDQQVQSMPDASPTKWHLAHTTWFFETFLLAPHLPGFAPFHPGYGYLFNSYYEAAGPRHPRPQRGLVTRPSCGEVLAYRAATDERVLAAIPRLPPAALGVLELGLAHEEQHQELLLTDVKHLLSLNPLAPSYRAGAAEPTAAPGAQAPPLCWVELPGGVREVGHAGPGSGAFAFDNEGPRHPVLVQPFALASRAATCGEWLAFVEDGGYRRPELWLSDGWAAVNARGWEAPLYWRRDGERWSVFTLGGSRPLDPAEPAAHVSLYEADAFARWSGARLPTEEEWEVAAASAPGAPRGRFADDPALHPAPAPAGAGPAQLLGDVWEWTRSAYAPYRGFTPGAGALGEYNGKFMCSQLVLRGGSCATPPGHVRETYRNFFYPDARWQFSGVRLARDA
jgi:ergothioneine biosynthesis protein EgtB